MDEIQQIVARLGAEENLRHIDIELSLDKLRDVYDLLLSLRSEARETTQKPTPVVQFEANERRLQPTEEKKDDVAGKPGTEIVFKAPKDAEITKKKPFPIKEKKEETQAEIHSRVKGSVQPIGNTFSDSKPSLNEELSHTKQKTDLSSRLNTKPIHSLKDAIGLNEKFEMIQNLFNGDSEQYVHTMDVLNMATHFNEAYDYLTKHFNWDMDGPLVQRILELIRRKLIVGKNG